jgi:short-subunit dehydrogenase
VINHPPSVVAITGASAGVGRATARLFAARGAQLGLIARGAEGLDATRREIEAVGGTACVCSLDVADSENVEAAAARIEETLGPVDVWINNAMTSVFSPFSELSAEEYERVTRVTYLGCVHGTMAALRRMQPRDRGTIVQVGSALAYRGIPLQSAYCGAKHAIRGFTESLRCELMHEHSGVRITMVQLPALNTPHFDWVKSRLPRRAQPVPPIYQPETAARAILRAAFHPAREYRVGLSTSAAILAEKIAPALVDGYLARTGFDSQQYDGSQVPDRSDNLWRPVEGDFGAHGAFDARATGERDEARLLLGVRGAALLAATATAITLSRRALRR